MQRTAWNGAHIVRSEEGLRHAIGEFKEGITHSEGSALHLAGLGYAHALAGRKIEALKVLAELKELSKQSYVPSLELAIVYAGLGDKDQAFAWLEKASQERYFRVLYLKVDPRFDSLRSDPRFQSLLRRLNFPD